MSGVPREKSLQEKPLASRRYEQRTPGLDTHTHTGGKALPRACPGDRILYDTILHSTETFVCMRWEHMFIWASSFGVEPDRVNC